MGKNYEIIEHTADIGIRITGRNLKDLFKNAGLAIFELSSEKISTQEKNHKEISIQQKADNLEELFLNWLNELLSLSAARGVIFESFKFKQLDEKNLQAVGIGSRITNYKVNTEIKAATYHQLKITKKRQGWQAEVILDV
ncbi:MAG: archease [Candidatus Omnitrophica bacterium]|nr:archease [Candidatus Omnitrophota bacterium]